MDKRTVERVKDRLEDIAEKEEIEIEQVIVFGSRARDDYTEESDMDILVISRDFEGVNWFRRPKKFYLGWNYDELPRLELLCYTPEEFEEKRTRQGSIVKTAAEEGVFV